MADQFQTLTLYFVVGHHGGYTSIKSSCRHDYSSLPHLVRHGRPFFRCLLAPMKIWFGQSSIRYLSYYNIRIQTLSLFSFHILIAPIEMYRKCGLPKSGLKFNWPLDKIGLKMANYYFVLLLPKTGVHSIRNISNCYKVMRIAREAKALGFFFKKKCYFTDLLLVF